MKGDPHDPKALIREAYRIDGITEAECRTIFLEWALDSPQDVPVLAQILLDRHAGEPADHPMTCLLRQALRSGAAPRRRGGRAGRRL